MSLAWLRDVPRQFLPAPRVDGKSIVLEVVSGEKEQAKINDAALTNDHVALWDTASGNKRLKTTGVSNTMLQVLNGVTPGTAVASKALVLDTNRDLTNVRDLTVRKINATNIAVDRDLTVGEKTTLTELVVDGATQIKGLIGHALRLATASKIVSRYNNVDYDVFLRDSNNLKLGNSTNDLYLITPIGEHVRHVRGGFAYKMWDASNHGVGSGLNADLLDGLHAASFLRSDQDAEMNGNIILKGKFIEYRTDANNDRFILRLNPTNDQNFEVFDKRANKSALRLEGGTEGYIDGKKIMHTANGGHGSNFDADTLDGQEGSWYRNVDNLTGTLAVGKGGIGRTSLPVGAVLLGNGTNPVTMMDETSRKFVYTGSRLLLQHDGANDADVALRITKQSKNIDFLYGGSLLLPNAPTADNHAARKDYIDTNFQRKLVSDPLVSIEDLSINDTDSTMVAYIMRYGNLRVLTIYSASYKNNTASTTIDGVGYRRIGFVNSSKDTPAYDIFGVLCHSNSTSSICVIQKDYSVLYMRAGHTVNEKFRGQLIWYAKPGLNP